MAQLCYEAMKLKEPVLRDSPLYVFYTGKHEITKPEGPNSGPSRFVLVTLASLEEEINPEVIENMVKSCCNPVKVIKILMRRNFCLNSL